MKERRTAAALWLPGQPALTFGDLDDRARRAANLLLARGIRPLDQVLLAIDLSYDLYAWVLAAARLGATILLVEPWLALDRLEAILAAQRPRFFVAGWMGKLWGQRLRGVRRIEHAISAGALATAAPEPHQTATIPLDTPCLIAFTSGTTGDPKGLVRSHAYLEAELHALNSALGFDQLNGPDLAILANFVLANLANGRASLVIPGKWATAHIEALDQLPPELRPVSLTTGPGFLRRFLEHSSLTSLRSLHVGGALTSNSFFERCFARFPAAHVSHIYGSSEAEPVAVIDAREAVTRSRAQGYFHTLCLGHPWQGIQWQFQDGGLWVAGAHVSPEYLGNQGLNERNKRRDQQGVLWHRMGDRLEVIDGHWFYAGRDQQPPELFATEQRLYALLGHDRAFLTAEDGVLALYVEVDPRRGLPDPLPTVRACLPAIGPIFHTTINYDARHRARIDRRRSRQRARLKHQGPRP